MTSMQTVVELPEFLKRATSIMSAVEQRTIVDFVAQNPLAGTSLGGGLRKVRVPRQGGGKSGGYRVIYVFGGVDMPIFLVTVFAKNEKSNLSQRELNTAVELSKRLITLYGERK